MRNKKNFFRVISATSYACIFCGLVPLYAYGQQNSNGVSQVATNANKPLHQDLMFTTKAYNDEALNRMIDEANRLVQDLHLPENVPIKKDCLVEQYISPPRLAHGSKIIGNITTSNFFYVPFAGNRLAISKVRSEINFNKSRSRYELPLNQMDENAAEALALKFLAEVSIDVKKLAANCNAHVTVRGKSAQSFVPIYRVYWQDKGRDARGSVAEVELYLPTESLYQLSANKAAYILRKPIVMSDLARFLPSK